MPEGGEFEWMTILGTEGFVHATRISVERRCEYLCGDEMSEECHWEGLYRPVASIASIGVAVGALPGRLDLADYVSFAPGPTGDSTPDVTPDKDSQTSRTRSVQTSANSQVKCRRNGGSRVIS